MNRLIFSGFSLWLALFLGCAASGEFQKNERVTLILHDGHKIKCYVTHIGRDEVFFQATRSADAYNYGDMLNAGQIQKIRLANDSEMTVAEFREYRTRVQKNVTPVITDPAVTPAFDPLFEKLKHKEIDKMSEKEFRYFLLMKEQENMLFQKNLELQRQTTGMDKLSHQLEELKEQTIAPPVPPQVMAGPARVAEPVPGLPEAVKMPPILNLLGRTEMIGLFLQRVRGLESKGMLLTPEEKSLVSLIAGSTAWKQLQHELQLAGEQAAKALEQAFLLQPEALKTQLGFVFGPDDAFDFPGLLQQLHQQAGPQVSISYQRSLAQLLGDEGSRAMRTLLQHFETWQFLTSQP